MSSSGSSSSQPPRTPLHERSNSDNNKQQIRLVPYSPPRPPTGASQASGSQAAVADDDTPGKADEASRTSWARTRNPLVEEGYGFDQDFDFSSPTSSPARPTRPRRSRTRVSGSWQVPESFGREPSTPTTPVANRPTVPSMSRRQSAPAQPFHSQNVPTSPLQRPQSRRSRVIKVHADGTFSLDLKPARESERTASSITHTSTATSSHELASSLAPSAEIPSSPPSSVPERSVSPPATIRGFAAVPEEESPTPSPWNYRMFGGLRKVADAPNLRAQKGKGKEKETEQDIEKSPSVTPVQETFPARPATAGHTTKQSFNSIESGSDSTNSTIEEATNYKVIGRSSPPQQDSDIESSSEQSSEGNYRILGQSSPVQPLASSPPAPEYLDTPGSRNFVVHGGTPSSLVPFPRLPRPQYSSDSLSDEVPAKYSQESLLIPPPLNPQSHARRQSSQERFGGYFQRLSRESLRGRSNSFSTISSIISQDTASLLVSSTPNLVRIHNRSRSASTSSFHPPSWAGPSGLALQQQQGPSTTRTMDQHAWTSQLSPVVSEYEGSDIGSRLASAISRSDRGSSSAPGSRGSRQLLRISSALSAAPEEEGSISQTPPELLERPSPAYMRGALPSPAVRDVDEHGDGLADLHRNQLHHKPSWRSYLSRRGSDRELHSAASSRAGSLTSASIPTWAWLYYGSGERRWLATVPSIQSIHEVAQAQAQAQSQSQSQSQSQRQSSSRPTSSSLTTNGSPNANQPSPIIWNPRRRPREVLPAPAASSRPGASASASVSAVSVDVIPAGEGQEEQEQQSGLLAVPRRLTKKTSSIWSPHLRFDRRSTLRYSVWEPPSMAWVTAAEGGGVLGLGLRNVQVLLFVVGFGIPFAWMVAAFLPLPPKPMVEMFQQDGSATGLGISKEQEEAGIAAFDERVAHADDTKFQNARWWRNLNRVMSVIGLLILGTIIALAVVGSHQGFGR